MGAREWPIRNYERAEFQLTQRRTVVVDYGVGNIGSILNMLRKIGAPAMGSASPTDLADAGHIILPGVGSFDTAMAKLEDTGIIPILEEKVRGDGVPLLGICLGMQILTAEARKGNGQGSAG
jgi:glutamine amidotransferase